MTIPFQTIQTQDQEINRIQANISSAFNSITGPFVGGVFLQNISLLGSIPKVINHGLNRQPQLWVLCDQNADATVWRIDWDVNSITLESGPPCVISIWVN